jgi:predicted ATPase
LFTDLESSTRLWDEHPEAMRAALARHDAILVEAVEAHRGQVVKSTGDGLHAVFTSAEEAVGAAVAAQVALGSEPWGSTGPLRVRMGLHSGVAERRGGDYFGPVLNRAARLMSVAHGGQILVSLATEELVPGGGVEFVDLGEHALRDLARPEQVFQVAHPGLLREFPRLASLDAFVGNLPLQVTSFVGRDGDVARIAGMLDDASLVTLMGTGGVGKTRLAVQVAAEVLPRFGDGAWFCELAAADDGDAMAQVVATTLGCRQHPGLSLAESIVEYLKVRELLLVLDNCEHLLDDAGALADAVLRGCAHVTILATSREALDVIGERVVRVRSLDAPAPSATGDKLLHSDAVRLFADRCADAGADTAWDDRQWGAVGEICRRVDGIPLAIELAAARTASMSPIDIASHLDERFRLLTGKRRGRVERHQTLRATVEWSYQLLEDRDERVVFDRLGVFAGSFDGPAAVAVAGGDGLDSWQVTDALSSLVAKSMLGAETGPDGTTRYALNETLRQFARERLDESGDIDRWRRAHAGHYASWAHDAGWGLTGSDDVRWMARLRPEFDNVRAAIAWSLDRDDPDEQGLGLRIVASLGYLRSVADLDLGALAVQAVPAAEASRAELRAAVLTVAAYREWNQGRVERAQALAQSAMRDGILATTVNPLAPYGAAEIFEMTAGNYARAFEIADQARAALDTVDNPYAVGWFLAGTATFEAMAGRIELARASAEGAMERARQTGNRLLLALALQGTAWALQRDDPAAGLAAVEQCLDLYGKFHIDFGASSTVMALAGGLRARLGDDSGALQILHEAILVARDQGVRPQLAAALDWALSPLRRTGRPDIAATLLGGLTHGALADVGNWPPVKAARARTLDQVRAVLGDEKTHELVARGATMSYDELVQYAIHRVDQPNTERA